MLKRVSGRHNELSPDVKLMLARYRLQTCVEELGRQFLADIGWTARHRNSDVVARVTFTHAPSP